MLGKLRAHLASNLVGYIALFVAMSGTAYAAATVGSPEVVNNSLRSIDIANGTGVGGADVINNSLSGADVTDNALTGSDINESSLNVGRIAAHATSTTDVTTPQPAGTVNIPLTVGTVTVPAGAVVPQIIVLLQFDTPGPCSGTAVEVAVSIGGTPVGTVSEQLGCAGNDDVKVVRYIDNANVFTLYDPTNSLTYAITAVASDETTSYPIHIDRFELFVPILR